MFGEGELVLSKDVWQQLISLKFGVTVSRDKQITKQLEEGIYGGNVKTPQEETYLRNNITYIFKHQSKACEHNAKVAEGLSDLAQQMGNLNDFLHGCSSCYGGQKCHKLTISRQNVEGAEN